MSSSTGEDKKEDSAAAQPELAPSQSLLPDQESLAKDPSAVKDHSADVEALLKEIDDTAVSSDPSQRDEIVDRILALEKRARQDCDAISVAKLATKLLSIFRSVPDWSAINAHILSLSKKRGQLRRVTIDMLRLAMTWLDETPDRATKDELIKTLSQISEGKIFVEVERARLIRYQAKLLEDEGKIDEAALLLQEVQVETFGAMNKREKAEYILDQMRLVILRKDFIRTQIISRKINPKVLEAEDLQDLKLIYYRHMVTYNLHEKDYLNTAKAYWSIYDTACVKISNDWKEVLESYAVYLVLASQSKETEDLLKSLKETEQERLEKLPNFSRLVDDFTSTELVFWPLPYEADIKGHTSFKHGQANEKELWEQMRSRFLQRNIIILAKYYSRITLSRVSEFLSVPIDECEALIAKLVNDKVLFARIDRPMGTVQFEKAKDAVEKLNGWGSNISNLLDILQQTSHLIANDRMVHAALEKRVALMAKSAN